MQGASLLMLLRMPAVQKEIELSDDQKTDVSDLQSKMQEQMRTAFGDFRQMQDLSEEERAQRFADARKKAEQANKQSDEQVAKILDAKQLERLKQLQLQREGVQALVRAEVVAKLKLSDDQQTQIKKTIDDSRRRRPGGFNPNQTDDERRAAFAKMQQQREATLKSALAVLDDDQLLQWSTLVGKEFKFPQGPGFGPGGPGGPGGRGPGGPGGPGGRGPGGPGGPDGGGPGPDGPSGPPPGNDQ